MYGKNGARDPIIFSGNAHPKLANDVCEYLRMSPGKIEVFKFVNDNTFVRILENVRERDVFIIQPTVPPINDNIMELLIMMDACKRASAGRITAVIPYYSYARTDKKDQPRVPITARLVADLVTTAGADRALLVDLHAGQVQGFFSCPVDELTALPLQIEYFSKLNLENPVVVASDVGISKRARDFASRLNAPLAIVEKRRLGNNDSVQTMNVIGEVKGKQAILIDDEITSGGTNSAAMQALLNNSVDSIYTCATHGSFTEGAVEKLSKVEKLRKIVVTDTVPTRADQKSDKVDVISIAPLIGEAIRRINRGQSVGALFSN